MYLIAEEIIRGDRLDGMNPFRWHHVELNLPGTPSSDPASAWLTKRRTDGSLASEMVVFVDDKILTASSSSRTKKAGHASSTWESYIWAFRMHYVNGDPREVLRLREHGRVQWCTSTRSRE